MRAAAAVSGLKRRPVQPAQAERLNPHPAACLPRAGRLQEGTLVVGCIRRVRRLEERLWLCAELERVLRLGVNLPEQLFPLALPVLRRPPLALLVQPHAQHLLGPRRPQTAAHAGVACAENQRVPQVPAATAPEWFYWRVPAARSTVR